MTAPSSTGMRFAAALSTSRDTRQAAMDVCRAAGEALGATADLAAVFASIHHGPRLETLAALVSEQLAPGCLIGCTGESIVGTAREVEDEPAVSLWLASLPKATVTPLRLQFESGDDGGTFLGWPGDLAEPWPAGTAMVLLGEPFSFPADWLLQKMNEERQGVPVLGGLASGAHQPGENRLIFGGRVFNEGAVGAVIHGPLVVRAVVSQGCRPIGRHYVVTKAERNVILELGGKPPLVQLQEAFTGLSPQERQLVERGLHVGRAINEYQDNFGRGDFLVRNCIGADRDTGAIAVGDFFRSGQTVQFHIRDARTADEDLRELLAAARQQGGIEPRGALLFTCNGRGTRLFDAPHHDAAALADVLGSIPVAGFFAQGEMGPIGGKNFLHGFTASAALFCPAPE